MKRLILVAFLTGTIAGFLKNFRVLLGLLFQWPSGNIYSTIIWLLLTESLFAGSISATKGIAERSFRLVIRGFLIGTTAGFISVGFLSILITLAIIFDASLDYSAFSSIFVGLSAGILWSYSEPSKAASYLLVVSGFLAGIVGIGIYFLIKFGLVLIAFIVAASFNDDYFGFVLLKVLTPPAYGAAQSAFIWGFIAIAKNYFFKRSLTSE